MGPSRVPKYRHHQASGRAVVRIAGRDVYLGKHGTPESKAEYRRLLGEWMSSGIAPQPPSGQHAVSIEELVLAYWRHAKQHYVKGGQPTSERGLVKAALRWVRRNYKSTRAVDFTPLSLKTIRDAMVASDRYCRNVINLHIGRIRRMFRWATANCLVPASVYQALLAVQDLQEGRTTARESTPVRPVTPAQVDAVLPRVSRQVAAMIELQRLTGARPGEIVMMRAIDLDTSGELWTYRPASHKTQHHGKERTIILGARAQAVVRPFLKPDLQGYLFSPKDAVAERNARLRAERKTPMTPSQAARKPKAAPAKSPKDHYTTGSYARAIACACDAAKADHWHPNQLRHAAATHVRSIYGIETARVILGHSHVSTTEIYAEADLEKARKVMREVG